jgi:hypothetical protein
MLGTPYFAILDLRPKPIAPVTVPAASAQTFGSAAPVKSKLGSSLEVFVIPTEQPTKVAPTN